MRIPGLPLVVLLLGFAFLLCQPLAIGRADESHLLHGARRVLDGEVLYRDFFEIITPLGFYFFAAVYWLFGTTLRAARVAMALVDAIGGAALFVVARRIAGTGPAVLATMLFVAVCLPAWPIASAHWMLTTLALLVAAVLLRERPAAAGPARPLVAGVLTGAAICMQQQRGVFVALWLGAAVAVLAVAEPGPGRARRLVRDLTVAILAAGSVTAVVLGSAALAASPGPMIDALYRFPVETYAQSLSVDVGWAGVVPLTGTTLPDTWHWLLRVAPIFPALEAVFLLGGLRRGFGRAEMLRGLVCLLAGLMIASVWYLRDYIHVAFVMPFLLLPGAGLVDAIRRGAPRVRGLVAAALVVVGVIVGVKAVTNVRRAQAAAPAVLDTAFGPIRADAFVASLYAAVRRHLVHEADGRALAYSYPDDAWLYLTLPARDATRFEILLLSFPRRYVDEVVGALRARVPGTVVLFRPIPAGDIRDAVEAGYERVEEVGAFQIYVRRGSAGAEPTSRESSLSVVNR